MPTRAQVADATERLNRMLASAQAALVELELGVEASVRMYGDVMLQFLKLGGRWGLFITSAGGGVIPILSAPRIQRSAAAAALGPLRSTLEKNARDIAAELEDAVAIVESFLGERTADSGSEGG